MLCAALSWLGFADAVNHPHGQGHDHRQHEGHGPTHGVIDPAPIVGLIITAMIFGIVWQARCTYTNRSTARTRSRGPLSPS
jgi:hypothetical protein